MKEYANQLRDHLEAELREIYPDGDAIKGYDRKAVCVRIYLEMLASYVRKNPFADQRGEIQYFKYIAPTFYRDYYFYRKLYWLEVIKITSDEEKYRLFLLEQLERCRTFIEKRHRLHEYFYSLRTHRDERLFTRKKSAGISHGISIDNGYYECNASCRLGLIFAAVQYRDYCEKELQELVNRPLSKRISSLKCNLTKTEAAEFVSIAYEMKLFTNNGMPYTQSQVKEWVEQQWNIDLKDFKNIDKNSRDRKGVFPSLITKMLMAYDIRKDRLENELRKKR